VRITSAPRDRRTVSFSLDILSDMTMTHLLGEKSSFTFVLI
jgi:hypothetical protein